MLEPSSTEHSRTQLADVPSRAGEARHPSKTPQDKLRWWVFLLGAALIPPNSLWIARAEAMDYSGFPTCASLFYNVIFSLMVLMLINSLVRLFAPRACLSRWELLIVYGMVATGSSLVGHDTMQMLVPSVAHAKHFATPENRWEQMVLPHLPTWLTIQTPGDALTNYERGFSTLYKWEYIRVWLVPIAAWTTFLCAGIGSMLSVVVLLRRHWVEHERLTYPIVQIPVLITENGGSNSLFRNKLFWAGFAIAAGIDLLNGLAQFFPNLPTIPVKMTDISGWFASSPPWNAMGWTQASFYPFVIGLSFFMPTNMAFSSWFFFFFRKAQQILSAAFGYSGGDPWFPYLKEQAFGALIALFISTLWFGRGYIKEVVHSAFTGEGITHDGGIAYKWVLAVLAICLAAMMAFLIAAGMSAWLAVVYVILYIMFCGAFARIRAELGPPAHELGLVGPSHMLLLGLGSSVLGPQNLTIFSLLWFQNRMHRGILMPQQAECLKAASQTGMRTRTMVGALAASGLLGVLAAFWALMHLAYSRHAPAFIHPGAPGSAFSAEALNQLMSWLQTRISPNYVGVISIIGGAAFAMLLAKLSVTFYGFPFHPAGYALGMAFGMDYIWLPVMISWFLKVMILRYAGLKGYQRAIPFFVGLVLGEFAIGGMWSFVRGILGVQTYTFYY